MQRVKKENIKENVRREERYRRNKNKERMMDRKLMTVSWKRQR